ncbi:uncharacterized protein PgNI_01472 [Pyricularia grisea]|uniref:Uncharacterized protein n=1 Tax=Pyricularia grisea TaxID=148305 RepID=A0A6P8BGG8_PYRGI|nr:uncharacterized protein PgNI_01472 [Pyricularia grisea]TLD15873.1 hypothetical protein PgNI_01472 [Pyricularia grisea]
METEFFLESWVTNDRDDDCTLIIEGEKLKRPFDKIFSAFAPSPPSPPFTLDNWLNPEWSF